MYWFLGLFDQKKRHKNVAENFKNRTNIIPISYPHNCKDKQIYAKVFIETIVQRYFRSD